MEAFKKRRYRGVRHLFGDARALWPARRDIVGILRGKTISGPFRERLMLAVTAVTQCRYCAFAHTRQALKEGVSREELDGLFQGTFAGAPEEERTAILYAHHWAETEGKPEAETVARLNAAYGPETAQRINTTLRFINLCNLSGNTFDWLLHSVSFGLLGGG